MARSSVVTLTGGAPAVLIHTGTSSGTQKNGVAIKSLKTNSGIIYIGGVGVTATNGYPLDANEAVGIDPAPGELTYAFAPATSELRLLQVA